MVQTNLKNSSVVCELMNGDELTKLEYEMMKNCTMYIMISKIVF